MNVTANPSSVLGWSRLPAHYAIPPTPPTLAEAREYCPRLARTHYENFSVASWFLPRRLRQHFFNVYSYCRISDDLGDEVGDAAASLELLGQWQRELDGCYEGAAKHPVFVALAETVRQFDIPKHEFSDLLIAFRQDQTITRFETFSDLFDYCRYSANPVGHLVLYLCGYRDAERQFLSDFTCTALQLANFWQDVSVDLQKDRIYIPLSALADHGLKEADIVERRFDARYVALMKSLISRSRELFAAGLPLAQRVDSALRTDLELFSRGGLAILSAIERSGYDTLQRRPSLSSTTRLVLVGRALGSRALGLGKAPPAEPTSFDSTPSGVGAEIPLEQRMRGAEMHASAEQIRESYVECNRIARAAHSSF